MRALASRPSQPSTTRTQCHLSQALVIVDDKRVSDRFQDAKTEPWFKPHRRSSLDRGSPCRQPNRQHLLRRTLPLHHQKLPSHHRHGRAHPDPPLIQLSRRRSIIFIIRCQAGSPATGGVAIRMAPAERAVLPTYLEVSRLHTALKTRQAQKHRLRSSGDPTQ
jgi:hypothetical protein